MYLSVHKDVYSPVTVCVFSSGWIAQLVSGGGWEQPTCCSCLYQLQLQLATKTSPCKQSVIVPLLPPSSTYAVNKGLWPYCQLVHYSWGYEYNYLCATTYNMHVPPCSEPAHTLFMRPAYTLFMRLLQPPSCSEQGVLLAHTFIHESMFTILQHACAVNKGFYQLIHYSWDYDIITSVCWLM